MALKYGIYALSTIILVTRWLSPVDPIEIAYPIDTKRGSPN